MSARQSHQPSEIARAEERRARRRAAESTRAPTRNNGTLSRCPCCGACNPTAMCCPLAPEPTEWCAWCGADVDGDVGRIGNATVRRQVFCDPRCARSYHEDLADDVADVLLSRGHQHGRFLWHEEEESDPGGDR